MKRSLLDMARLLLTSTPSSCGHLRMIKPVTIPQGWGRGVSLISRAAEGRRFTLLWGCDPVAVPAHTWAALNRRRRLLITIKGHEVENEEGFGGGTRSIGGREGAIDE